MTLSFLWPNLICLNQLNTSNVWWELSYKTGTFSLYKQPINNWICNNCHKKIHFKDCMSCQQPTILRNWTIFTKVCHLSFDLFPFECTTSLTLYFCVLWQLFSSAILHSDFSPAKHTIQHLAVRDESLHEWIINRCSSFPTSVLLLEETCVEWWDVRWTQRLMFRHGR